MYQRFIGDSVKAQTKRIYGLPGMIALYFRENPDREVTVQELSKEFGVSNAQIQTAIHRIAGIELTVTRRGQVWKWESKPVSVSDKRQDAKTETMLFEYVGKSKDDKIIVRDENKSLYVLESI